MGKYPNLEYAEKGFAIFRELYDSNEIAQIGKVIKCFHKSWITKNKEFYNQNAINSAYLTGREHLDEIRRQTLFKFITSTRLMEVVHSIIPEQAAFMNTQLFFDPVNHQQNNYWHRDHQYHLSPKQQREVLDKDNVIHFRIPLKPERGVELVPGTHKRWDTGEELEIRLEENARHNHEALSSGVEVSLGAGDLLVFSGTMIHRGLYGRDRLALDIIFCDSKPHLLEFVRLDCLPSEQELSSYEDSSALANTIEVLRKLSEK
ncbi:MAG: phytanoyl-CoA dioxygenase family protein [Kangiellaceae bacterium]|nr:phytanoyl-CoA dioxygenase family protein [Kangiellaceae bacterium]